MNEQFPGLEISKTTVHKIVSFYIINKIQLYILAKRFTPLQFQKSMLICS